MKTTKRRFVALALVLYLLLGVTAPAGSAAMGTRTTIASGICGENVTWALYNDGELRISGEGPMSDDDTPPWHTDYRDKIISVTIEEGVTTIGGNAFWECPNLTSVSIPDSVSTIGNHAFVTSKALRTITIPAGVTNIHDSAFDGTRITTFVVAPGNTHYTAVGGSLYTYDRSKLIRFKFGEASVTVPNGVVTLGDGAFRSLDGLQTLSLPASITEIGSQSVSRCEDLTDIIVSSGNPAYCSVGGVLFTKDRSMLLAYPPRRAGDSYTVPDGVLRIGESAFEYAQNLRSVALPDSVTSIDVIAFFSAQNLTQIRMGAGVTQVNMQAFAFCSNLKTLILSHALNEIGTLAFQGCSSLTDVYYPGISWDDIGIGERNDFLLNARWHYACTTPIVVAPCEHGAASVSYPFTAPGDTFTVQVTPDPGYTLAELTVDHGIVNGCEITVPAAGNFEAITVRAKFEKLELWPGETPLYSGACGGGLSWGIFDDGSLRIAGSGAMDDYDWSKDAPWMTYRDQITSISIEDGITHIGQRAFYTCWSATELGEIPASVTSIGDGAFAYCRKLTSIPVDEHNQSFTSVDGILMSRDDTTLIQYPAGKFMPLYQVPDGVSCVRPLAFAGTQFLVRVEFPVGVTAIPEHAFRESRNLLQVSIPSGVTTIGEEAFFWCAELESIALPDTLTTVGRSAFYNCNNLADVYYGGGETSWSAIAIAANNTALENATVHYEWAGGILLQSGTCGEDVEWSVYSNGVLILSGTGAVPDYSAAGAPWYDYRSVITSVRVGDGITAIGQNAFSGCNQIADITLPGSRTMLAGTGAPNTAVVHSVEELSDLTLETISAQTYNAAAHTPAITLKDGSTALVKDRDYTVEYTDNVNAGTATVALSATQTAGETENPATHAKYTGSKTVTFAIEKAPLSVTAKAQTITYGESITRGTGQVTVTGLQGSDTLDSVTLTPSTANVPGGIITPSAATVKNGANNVTANYAVTYVTGDLTIGKATYAAPDAPVAAEVTNTSVTLVAIPGAEYSLDGESWQNELIFNNLTHHTAYTFYARIKADSNHNASPASEGASITTSKALLSNAVITVSGSYIYNTAAQVPAAENVTVKLGDVIVDPDEYTILASNNTNAGTATLIITATEDGHYSGNAQTVFTIAPAALTVSAVSAADRAYEPENNAVLITEVTLDGVLGLDDVAVDLSALTGQISAADAGTYTSVVLPELTLTGAASSNYILSRPSGAVSTTVVIAPKAVNAPTVTLKDRVPYTGQAVTPALTVRDGETILSAGDYDAVYTDNTAIGTATVTVTLKGNYSGTTTAQFEINYSAWEIRENGMLTVDVGDIPETWMFCAVGYSNGHEMLWIKLVTNETGPIDTTTADKVVFFLLDDDLLPQMGKEPVK